MTYKILTSNASADSAMKLRDAIERVLGMEPKTILVSKNSNNCQGDTVIARYGCGYGHLNQEPEWNSPVFINLCISKFDFSELFKEIVPVPLFHNDTQPSEFPVLIRDTLTGTQSNGVHVVHGWKEFLENWSPNKYWTPFFDVDFELRVLLVLEKDKYHCRIYKKEPVDVIDHDRDFIVREDNTSWKLKDPSYYPKVTKILEKMAPTIYQRGGRFAGLDMIYVPARKDYVVLEANSGPWLSLKAAEWLAGIFVKTQWNKFKT